MGTDLTMRSGVLRLYSIVRWRARLASQDGMALLVALGALMVLAVAGTTVIYYSSANTRSASYSKASGTSFQLAEAGLHEALSVLSNPSNDPTNGSLLATRTSPYSTGSVTWGGTYDCAIAEPCDAKWTITSTGKVANPANVPPSEATRTITAKVPIRPVLTQATVNESWNYLFSYGTGDPSGCDMTVGSSISIETRLIVAGNLCIRDSATIEGSGTEVEVGGQVKIFGSASIGRQSANYAGEVNAAGNCKYESGTVGTCNSSRKVWTNATSTNPTLQAAPNPNWSYWYSNASPGPIKNCTGANRVGAVPTFDNDTTQDRDLPAPVNLTPTSNYTCRTYIGAQPLGELSWNNTTKVLTVLGTIFFDGDLQITQQAEYNGQATIYVAGSFWMGGSNMMCAVKSGSSDCNWATSGGWDPNTELLGIVTKGAGGNSGNVEADTTVKIDSSAKWQGAIYGGPYKAKLLSSVRVAGPVIADEVYVESSLQTEPFTTIVTSPTALPGNSTTWARPDKLELFSG
jgi:Tfp pilus assembly protein PilX